MKIKTVQKAKHHAVSLGNIRTPLEHLATRWRHVFLIAVMSVSPAGTLHSHLPSTMCVEGCERTVLLQERVLAWPAPSSMSWRHARVHLPLTHLVSLHLGTLERVAIAASIGKCQLIKTLLLSPSLRTLYTSLYYNRGTVEINKYTIILEIRLQRKQQIKEMFCHKHFKVNFICNRNDEKDIYIYIYQHIEPLVKITIAIFGKLLQTFCKA